MTFLRTLFAATLLCLTVLPSEAQPSVAHRWIDANLEAVRRDWAKPTVAARNLWHTSAVMYDAWAVYDPIASPYLLGNSLGDYESAFEGMPATSDTLAAQEQAISYAAYRILKHRYSNSPGSAYINYMLDSVMVDLGYTASFSSTDYVNDGPAALGNYIAQEMIAAGLLDQSNEINGYENQYYESVNDTLVVDEAHFIGNPDINDLNRWQTLGLTLFCDASGNGFTYSVPFLSAEWGNVIPFSLADSVKSVQTRDGQDWVVYHDPGPPPYIALDGGQETEAYRWGFETVTDWSSFLDPNDPITLDISPASMGNIPYESLPTDQATIEAFYEWNTGEVTGSGYAINPSTGLPYEPQMVKRGDYARAIAEYWVDGPNRESPPGYWYLIYNQVSQGSDFNWMWNGEGEPISELEFDVRSYFTLGGAMHDAAIAAWGAKGYYDYIRPVSAIRAMAELGQSSEPLMPNYHPAGLELEDGYVAFIQLGDTIHINDTIRIANADDVDLLKIKAWVGPFTTDTCIPGFAPEYDTTAAGVGWRYALDYWPYQRPTYVTPPHAGFVSANATFSSAAAEVMTLLTGDSYFPDGMAEYECTQDEFLVFENGPSETITLQWATYQDAANQSGISRIFSGVNTPYDVLKGQEMGYEVGHNAYINASTYFFGTVPEVQSAMLSDLLITDADDGSTLTLTIEYGQPMDISEEPTVSPDFGENTFTSDGGIWLSDSIYVASYLIGDGQEFSPLVTFEIQNGNSIAGLIQSTPFLSEALHIDMLNPVLEMLTASVTLIDNSMIGANGFSIEVVFDDEVDQSFTPSLDFPTEDPSATLTLNSATSEWMSSNNYRFDYEVSAVLSALDQIDVELSNVFDTVGNPLDNGLMTDVFSIDIISGIVDYSNEELLIVYPNPVGADQDIIVKQNKELSEGVIRFSDSCGSIIEEWPAAVLNQSDLIIASKNLSAGSYSLSYVRDKLSSSQTVVVTD